MTYVDYNLDIPDGPNNPSADQPLMKINTNAVNTILNVDHVGFQDNDGGLHQRVTFEGKNAQGAQTDPQSVLFTASGSASTVSDVRFRNQNGTFPISLIRAAGAFTTTGVNGAVAIDNGYNVDSITRTSSGVYAVVLTAGVTTGNNVIVVTGETNTNGEPIYSYTNPTLTITMNSNSGKVSFLVLQA